MSWVFKKQTCIAVSSMKVEFIALTSACKEAGWLRDLMFVIPLLTKPISPITIHCDSHSALSRAYSQVYNGKSRHIGVRHSYVQELIVKSVITVDYVKTQLNLADSFTKAMARDCVKRMAIGIGLVPIVDHNEGIPT